LPISTENNPCWKRKLFIYKVLRENDIAKGVFFLPVEPIFPDFSAVSARLNRRISQKFERFAAPGTDTGDRLRARQNSLSIARQGALLGVIVGLFQGDGIICRFFGLGPIDE
jgi:hypothetical protein